MEKGWLTRQIASGGVTGIFSWLTTTYIIPVGIPIMAIIVGWAQGVPWFYLIIGASFITVTMLVGLVSWDEWQIRTRVENKIRFRTVRFGNDLHGDGIVIMVEIDSLANFPIDFEVVELMVKLDDKIPKQEHKAGHIVEIPAMGFGWWNTHAIKIDKPPSPGVIDGSLSFTLRYGRFKNLKHTFFQKKNIVVTFNEQGLLTGGTHSDAKDEV